MKQLETKERENQLNTNKRNNLKVIADTCIWVEFFRTKSKNSNCLKSLIANDIVVVTGIILAELLQSVKASKERDVITDVFNTLECIEITKELWRESGNLARKLRCRGITIPISDIMLACCAQSYNYQIFTLDKHFKDIPGVKLFLASTISSPQPMYYASNG